jgi:hypothetical protein
MDQVTLGDDPGQAVAFQDDQRADILVLQLRVLVGTDRIWLEASIGLVASLADRPRLAFTWIG